MKFSIGLISLLAFFGTAVAADESEMALRPKETKNSLLYSHESYSTASTEQWYGVRSGILTGMVNKDLNKYRLGLASNIPSLLGFENSLLKKVQIEGHVQTRKPGYLLGGVELPLVSPITLFASMVYNQGGALRAIVGPIVYWSESNSQIFYYSKNIKGKNEVSPNLLKTNGAVGLRNRVRELPGLGIDFDLQYKFLKPDQGYDNKLGWGLGFQIWRFNAKYSVTPYYENLKNEDQTKWELGYSSAL